MLDIGWPELMVVAAVTVVVVGPREIPRVLRTVNGYVRKARSLASEFHSSIEDMAREADLDDLKKQMKDTTDDFTGDFEKSIDPSGEVSNSMRDIKDSMNERYSDEKGRAPGNSITPPKDSDSNDEVEAPAIEASAKKTPAKKTDAKKTPAKKTAVKKTAPKKTVAKKTAAKKTVAKKAAAPSSDGGKG
jgi:sec-independent protein translocase protein TatB